MPVSPVTPIVKPEGGQRRVLLLTSETALEAEVRDALRIWTLRYYLIFWRFWICWTSSDKFFRYDTHRAFSFYLVSRTPLRSSRSTPSPFKVFTVGSLITLVGRFREDPPRQQRIRDYCLGRRVGAPLSFKNGWAHSHIP